MRVATIKGQESGHSGTDGPQARRGVLSKNDDRL